MTFDEDDWQDIEKPAKSSHHPVAAVRVTVTAGKVTVKPEAFPITTQARGLEREAKAIAQKARSDVTAAVMGDPPVGRSALDQRRKP